VGYKPEPASHAHHGPGSHADHDRNDPGDSFIVPAPPGVSSSRQARVSGWIQQAVGILREHGYRPEQLDTSAIASIVWHESSGNPEAVNNWDANAARGTPATGLMQTIRPTFDQWHLPGHDNILHPVDNIIAGVRYALHRYGSVSQVPGVRSLADGGSYRGY
jgi:soluble lytic murein transglycosylase-like protein